MPRRTTVGRYLIEQALPEDMRNRADLRLDKKGLMDLMKELAARDPDTYRDVSFKLQKIGGELAYRAGGASFGLEHMFQTPAMMERRASLQKKIDAILNQKDLKEGDRNDAITKMLGDFSGTEQKEIMRESEEEKNPFHLQVISGARGSASNLMALRGGDVMYVDSQDRPIPIPVLHGYAQGLSPAEYWAATYGARKGVIETKLGVQNAGDLGKQLTRAAHRAVVIGLDRDKEDETPRGLPVDTDDSDNEGALLAIPAGKYQRNQILTGKILQELKGAGINKILVRSPAVSQSEDGGVYARDVGVREFGRLPWQGEFVGITAAQALSEPLAQATLSSKHSGGAASGTRARSGFSYIDQLAQVPKVFPGGAAHAQVDGAVDSIVPAPAGGWFVQAGGEKHYVPADQKVSVHMGQTVEAGDVLSDGIPNPATITRLKGVGEGRRYFTNAFREALRNSGITASRRNIELVAGKLINHVELDDELGDFVPGDVVPYSALEASWKPRPDFQTREPRQSVGQYLERPYLHYTIGTRVTPRVAQELGEFGINKVDVHAIAPPFAPEMIRTEANLHHDPDVMTRFLGTNLKANLLKTVPRGGTSDTAGTSYVPGLARAKDFGRVGIIQAPKPPPDFSARAEFPKRSDAMTEQLVMDQQTSGPGGQPNYQDQQETPIGLQIAMGAFPQLPQVIQMLGPLGLAVYGMLLSPKDTLTLMGGMLPQGLRQKLEGAAVNAGEMTPDDVAQHETSVGGPAPATATQAAGPSPNSNPPVNDPNTPSGGLPADGPAEQLDPRVAQAFRDEMATRGMVPRNMDPAQAYRKFNQTHNKTFQDRMQALNASRGAINGLTGGGRAGQDAFVDALSKSPLWGESMGGMPEIQKLMTDAEKATGGKLDQRQAFDLWNKAHDVMEQKMLHPYSLQWDHVYPEYDEAATRAGAASDPSAANAVSRFDQMSEWFKNYRGSDPFNPSEVPGLDEYLRESSGDIQSAQDPALRARMALDQLKGYSSGDDGNPLAPFQRAVQDKVRQQKQDKRRSSLEEDRAKGPFARVGLTGTGDPAARYQFLNEENQRRGDDLSPLQLAGRSLEDYEKTLDARGGIAGSLAQSPMGQALPGMSTLGKNIGRSPAQAKADTATQVMSNAGWMANDAAEKITTQQLMPVITKLQQAYAAAGEPTPSPEELAGLARSEIGQATYEKLTGRPGQQTPQRQAMLQAIGADIAPYIQQVTTQTQQQLGKSVDKLNTIGLGVDAGTWAAFPGMRAVAALPGAQETSELFASGPMGGGGLFGDIKNMAQGKNVTWDNSMARAGLRDVTGVPGRLLDRHLGTRFEEGQPSLQGGTMENGRFNRGAANDPIGFARQLVEDRTLLDNTQQMTQTGDTGELVDQAANDPVTSAQLIRAAKLERDKALGADRAREEALVGPAWPQAVQHFRTAIPETLRQKGFQFNPENPMGDNEWNNLALSMAVGKVPSDFKDALGVDPSLDTTKLFGGHLGGAAGSGGLGRTAQWGYGGLLTATPLAADAGMSAQTISGTGFRGDWGQGLASKIPGLANNRLGRAATNWVSRTQSGMAGQFPTTPRGGLPVGQAAWDYTKSQAGQAGVPLLQDGGQQILDRSTTQLRNQNQKAFHQPKLMRSLPNDSGPAPIGGAAIGGAVAAPKLPKPITPNPISAAKGRLMLPGA